MNTIFNFLHVYFDNASAAYFIVYLREWLFYRLFSCDSFIVCSVSDSYRLSPWMPFLSSVFLSDSFIVCFLVTLLSSVSESDSFILCLRDEWLLSVSLSYYFSCVSLSDSFIVCLRELLFYRLSKSDFYRLSPWVTLLSSVSLSDSFIICLRDWLLYDLSPWVTLLSSVFLWLFYRLAPWMPFLSSVSVTIDSFIVCLRDDWLFYRLSPWVTPWDPSVGPVPPVQLIKQPPAIKCRNPPRSRADTAVTGAWWPWASKMDVNDQRPMGQPGGMCYSAVIQLLYGR